MKKRLIVLSIMISAIVIALAVFFLFKSFLQFRNLVLIQDRAGFVKDFDSEGKTPIKLETCTDWSDLIYSWCVKSSLFPYKRLDITQIQQGIDKYVLSDQEEVDLSTESKWLLTDPL